MVVNKKQLPPKEATAVLLLPFNRYILLAFYGLRILLGDVQPQCAVLEFGIDVLFRDGSAYIEAAAAGSAVPFLTDVLAFLILFVLIQGLGGGDGQVALFQLYLDAVFLEARQVHDHIIAVLVLPDIRLHNVGRMLAIQRRMALAKKVRVHQPAVVHPVVK